MQRVYKEVEIRCFIFDEWLRGAEDSVVKIRPGLVQGNPEDQKDWNCGS